MINRGGQTLKEGYIGSMNCLRQQVMMPGERMNIRIKGKVRLGALRERDVMRINAHLAVFQTPMRWLDDNYTDLVRKNNTTQQTQTITRLDAHGIGGYAATGRVVQSAFVKACNKVYNNWYKWPEETDETETIEWTVNGPSAVPLSSTWSRCRYSKDPSDSGDYTVSSGTSFDVRELSRIQAQFRGAMKREVTSYGRWMELIDQTWKGDGSREVDQVPIMIDQVEVGVNPREIPATDGASLGQWQSLYDFEIDHMIKGVTAPEHCVLTYMLVLRFPPVIEGIHPLATDQMDWHELVADPEFIESQEPQQVTIKEMCALDSSTVLGYLPAGWQWRAEHDVLGKLIDDRDSFPYSNNPISQPGAKNATRIKNAFRSTSLGHYTVDAYFTETSFQPIGTSRDSYFSGMLDETRNIGQSSDEFPFGGKML
jgi:hypothetical protein